MNYAPIIIPTLCRYEKLKDCITSLSKCTHAENTDLIVAVDYPLKESHVDGWKKINYFLQNEVIGFKNIEIIQRERNYGASENSLLLEEYVLTKYDSFIYTEDDNIFSPNFLDFINKALEKFENDKTVVSISGYSYPIAWNTNCNCVLEKDYFSAWGFAIWKDRFEWYKSILDINIIRKEFLKNYKKLSKINFITCFSTILADKEIPVQDVSRSYAMQLFNKKFAMPTISLVKNQGWDNSGEHSKIIDNINFDKQIIDNNRFFDLNFEEKEINYQPMEAFIEEVWKNDIDIEKKYKELIRKLWIYKLLGYKLYHKLVSSYRLIKGKK